MDILCTAQKQTNFTNTLLQDITIFNGNDTTQLEDWLVDIETAANLSGESRTKLAQAKSKGLTHTLITEALTSGKCWDDITDLLCLKICNCDIHTPVSCVIEMQQKEKESLATYIHHFKREAKRSNFTNSAATIRIFVKGLENTHTIAIQVYEKGPQTLEDATSEVEKLQAAQQLIASLIPSSTVNVMPHEEDCGFQCQESGHIAHHWPNVHCFECNEYGHKVVDCSHWIPPSGMPAHHHRLKSHTRHHSRSILCHHHHNRYRCSRSRSQSHPHQYCSNSHNEPYRGHSRSHHRDNRHHHRSTSWCLHSSAYHFCCDTPHCRSSWHRSSSAHLRDCSRSQSCPAYKSSKKTLYKSSSCPSRTHGKSQDKRNPRVMIDDPQMEFYSSDHLN